MLRVLRGQSAGKVYYIFIYIYTLLYCSTEKSSRARQRRLSLPKVTLYLTELKFCGPTINEMDVHANVLTRPQSRNSVSAGIYRDYLYMRDIKVLAETK